MDAGLLPVKRLVDAKKRLSEKYDDDARLAVARALFTDAFHLCTSVDFLQWFVVTDDPEVADAAAERGFRVVPDPGEGLNPALRAGVDAAWKAGADSVTVIPADVPLAWKGDVQDLLDTGATSDVVLVPSGRDGGTNALYISPPSVIEPRFGEGSLAKHLASAEELHLRCSILSLPRLALDIDTPEDIEELLNKPMHGESKTVDELRQLRRS